MPCVVCVDGIEFDDLIPLLKENESFKDEVGYEYQDEEYIECEKRILKNLGEFFEKLKKGEPSELYYVGMILVECLDGLGRKLISTYSEASRDDYFVYPITKKQLEDFLEKFRR